MKNVNSQPNFDNIRQTDENGKEYWSARDLMPLLGYDKWQTFDSAIERAKTSMEQTGNPTENDFTGASKIVRLGAKATRTVKDYYLSRFACYLVAQNGDSRKPEIAAAQSYFAISTHQNELNQLAKRLEIYNHLTASEKRLVEAAIASGVAPENLPVFQDAGYKGLYGGRDRAEIKNMKGIAPEEDLIDRMGELELASNFFRTASTSSKLQRESIEGEIERSKLITKSAKPSAKLSNGSITKCPKLCPPSLLYVRYYPAKIKVVAKNRYRNRHLNSYFKLKIRQIKKTKPKMHIMSAQSGAAGLLSRITVEMRKLPPKKPDSSCLLERTTRSLDWLISLD
jgi:DNA-damage-inducible protein D